MKNILLTLLGTDGYKLGHREQYPEGTEVVFSNFTPRGSLHPTIKNEIEVFGLKYIVRKLEENWREFFDLDKQEARNVINEYKKIVENYLGVSDYNVDHLKQLYNYGRENDSLPLKIFGLPDYTTAKVKTPVFVVWNTDERFFWLVNYLETWLSSHTWQILTSATISKEYRKIMDKYAKETATEFFENVIVNYQGHDFSYRGMSSDESAILSGLGHLAHFKGTDSLPALVEWNRYFKKAGDIEVMSVNATEHSVMCAGGKDTEQATYERLLETYPEGIVSIVSDTWDIWNVLTNILPNIKDKIMSRDGKVVIRPDSGEPIDIICGTGTLREQITNTHLFSKNNKNGVYTSDFRFFGMSDEEVAKTVAGRIREWTTTRFNIDPKDIIKFIRRDHENIHIEEEFFEYMETINPTTPAQKGVIRLLEEVFGTTTNDKGFKVLDSHIGAIYGDSITLERAEAILGRLKEMGYSSENIVFGIGSFTYQYNTRDTFKFAMKATAVKIDGEWREIFKDPITDQGKKSAKGILNVVNGELIEQTTIESILENSDFEELL